FRRVPQCASAVGIRGEDAEAASLNLGAPRLWVTKVSLNNLNSSCFSVAQDDVSHLVKEVSMHQEAVELYLASGATG
ncbi:hypothetical protein QO169_29950, partial [Pseudomonas aeruginosa]|nr:hypothetical protein [Pseudomonas aeruginosa]